MSQSFNADPIFARVKATLIGGGGMEGLKDTVRAFREVDANRDGEVTPAEWRTGLKRLGVKLTDTEANYLFIAFDENKDGLISINEFVRNLIGQLNTRRTRVVDAAFQKFQLEGGPNVTISKNPANATVGCGSLLSTYAANSGAHPHAQSGAKSEAQLIREFAAIFDESRNPNGAITKEEFIGYYAAVSTTVAFDDVFEAMVLKAWGSDDPTAPRLGATARDWSGTIAGGSRRGANNGTISSCSGGDGKDPLVLERPLLHTQVLNTRLADTMGSKQYDSSHMTRQHPPFTPNPSVLPDYISTTKKDFVSYDEQQRQRADPLSTRRGNGAFEATATVARAMAASKGPSNGVPLTGNPLLDGLRRKVLARTEEEGFAGLRRSFTVMGLGSADGGAGAKVLAKLEARAALQRFKVSVTPVEFEQIWNYILRETEAGAGGAVTVGEFIRTLRGDSLTDSRLSAIRAAFEFLCDGPAAGGDGASLRLAPLAQLYNTNEHPAVRAGRQSRAEVLQSFMNSWPEAASTNGIIDIHQFVEYYEDLSASYDDDLAFELMIRTAWRMK